MTEPVAIPPAPPSDAMGAADDFVLALLHELRAGRLYRPRSWARFLARSWGQSRAFAGTHPQLAASWRGAAVALTLAQTGALAAAAPRLGSARTLAAALVLAPLHSWTLTDVWAHLSMNAPTRDATPATTLGAPNVVTLTRRSVADYLWARLLVGAPVTAPTALAALFAAGATDIADGALARGLQRQSRLGAYLDATADLEFWLALALTLALTRRLPAWLGALLAIRFLAPFAVVLASYFGLLARLPIGSTALGKAAGVAQALLFAEAVAPEPMRRRLLWLRPALRVSVVALLILAPLAQVSRLRHLRRLR